MSSNLNKARSKLNSVATLLKQEKLLAAVYALYESINIYLQTQLLKHEKQDFQRKLEETVFSLSSDKKLKENYPLIIKYEKGHEKTLRNQLKEILDELQESVTEEAQEQIKQFEEKKEAEFTKGLNHLKNNEYDLAEKIFEGLIKEFSEDTDLKISISDSYLEHGKLDEALSYLKKAYKDDPQSVHVFNKLGMAMRKAKKYTESEKAYFEALKRAPDDEFLYFNLGRLYVDTTEWSKALKASEKALEINPGFDEAQKMRKFSEKKIKTGD